MDVPALPVPSALSRLSMGLCLCEGLRGLWLWDEEGRRLRDEEEGSGSSACSARSVGKRSRSACGDHNMTMGHQMPVWERGWHWEAEF